MVGVVGGAGASIRSLQILAEDESFGVGEAVGVVAGTVCWGLLVPESRRRTDRDIVSVTTEAECAGQKGRCCLACT